MARPQDATSACAGARTILVQSDRAYRHWSDSEEMSPDGIDPERQQGRIRDKPQQSIGMSASKSEARVETAWPREGLGASPRYFPPGSPDRWSLQKMAQLEYVKSKRSLRPDRSAT